MNKKCNTSFTKSPESLEICLPSKEEPKVEQRQSQKSKKKQENED
jgi:hypothetical protein